MTHSLQTIGAAFQIAAKEKEKNPFTATSVASAESVPGVLGERLVNRSSLTALKVSSSN